MGGCKMGTIQDKVIQWCKRQEEQLNQFKKDLLEGDEKMIEGRIVRY
jgi:hypothetical protein